MLKIHELTTESGALEGVYLRPSADDDGMVELVEPGRSVRLPADALDKVMARYGAPFDTEAEVAVIAELDLGRGRRLRQVRHLAGYDVIARDYLVLDTPKAESLCALGTTVAGALQFLARAASERSTGAEARDE
jgi:hypothetical protein